NGIGEPGVVVNLTGDASAEITTDANGFFKFTDLDLGNYTVAITPPAGVLGASASPSRRPLNSSSAFNCCIASSFSMGKLRNELCATLPR
ncbi:MAG: hypothetical protein KAJ37_04490, partial [Candidatus Krumholzibacteria bacterium]|nr:hypothetical protein [Candidatus Krumholzibacteria bacterium]